MCNEGTKKKRKKTLCIFRQSNIIPKFLFSFFSFWLKNNRLVCDRRDFNFYLIDTERKRFVRKKTEVKTGDHSFCRFSAFQIHRMKMLIPTRRLCSFFNRFFLLLVFLIACIFLLYQVNKHISPKLNSEFSSLTHHHHHHNHDGHDHSIRQVS